MGVRKFRTFGDGKLQTFTISHLVKHYGTLLLRSAERPLVSEHSSQPAYGLTSPAYDVTGERKVIIVYDISVNIIHVYTYSSTYTCVTSIGFRLGLSLPSPKVIKIIVLIKMCSLLHDFIQI